MVAPTDHAKSWPSRWRRARLWALRLSVVALSLAVTDTVALLVLASRSPEFLYREPWSEAQTSMRARNNILLDGPARYPYPRHEDRWVVGVFGGSVAREFASTESPRTHTAAPWLELAADRGRPVHLQSFALSGTAQPTQYHLLRLFHESVHEAVFLDGFNELFIAGVPCDAVTRRMDRGGGPPRDELLRPLREAADEIHAIADAPWSELLWETAVGRTLYGHRSRAASELTERFFRGEAPGERTSLPLTPPPLPSRVARWSGCIEETHRFARAHGVRAHFFLQPNQHVRGTKNLSAEERACCAEPPPIAFALPTYRALTDAYAALEAEVAALRARGVSAWSLARVYERTAETVYTDRCCHVNALGNRLLGEAVAATLRGQSHSVNAR